MRSKDLRERSLEIKHIFSFPVRSRNLWGGVLSILFGKSCYFRCDRIWKGLLKFYGNEEYGGYWIYDKHLDSDSIVYSLGIGEDASFDMELISKKGCCIFAFDPTPMAKQYAKTISNRKFLFFDMAIAEGDGAAVFYQSEKTELQDGSGSLTQNKQSNGVTLTVVARSIPSLLRELGHEKIDLLKMDIEGTEYEVISDLLKNEVPVEEITVELHGRFFMDSRARNQRLKRELSQAGYVPIYNKPFWGGNEVTFLSKSLS